MNKNIHPFLRCAQGQVCSLLAALLICFLMLSNIYGTVLKKMSTRELTDLSHAIVIGKVKSVRSQWGDDGTKIYTYITVSVEECIKGNMDSSEFTIRQLGGEVGGIGLMVVGAPGYKEGEEILTFLKVGESNHFQCVDMVQGKYTIKTDYVTGKKILTREIDRSNGKRLDLRTPEDFGAKLFLDNFVSQIKTFIDEVR